MSGSPSRGITSVTYTVTASRHSGFLLTSPALLRDFELADYPVGGASSVTVEAPSTPTPSTPTPRVHPELQPGDRWPPAERVMVTIQAGDYGQALDGVTETLPAGFAYVSSDLRAQRE